jgi:hypothetical protein
VKTAFSEKNALFPAGCPCTPLLGNKNVLTRPEKIAFLYQEYVYSRDCHALLARKGNRKRIKTGKKERIGVIFADK